MSVLYVRDKDGNLIPVKTIQGPKGDTGVTGPPGQSAYELWLSKGNTGSESDFLNLLKGEKGDKGDPGATGAQGPKGDTGSAGSAGKDGVSPTITVSKSGKVTTIEITDANGTKTATINDGADGASGTVADTVPYYWQSALETGAEAINTAILEAGYNKSAFLFYSDAHWNYGSQMSPTLLKYLYENTGMNRTFFGGDIVNNEADDYDTMKYLWDWRKQLKDLPNHHSVVGNHDDGNTTNNLFTEQYVYGYLLSAEETPDMVRGDSGLYYYVDSPAEKTRYLCLDTAFKGVDTAQENFITEALKSTPSGWHIVVVSHIWYQPDYNQGSVRPIPIAGLDSNASKVITLLDNYNARNGAFSGCGAKVEFCIGGHVHIDYVNKTPGGIPIILVETDSQHVRSTLTYTARTTTEAAVNGIVADYTEKQLTVVRVGRGNSFTVDLTNGTSAELPEVSEPEPTYVNALDEAGYTKGIYLSSGVEKDETSGSDVYTTGFIPCPAGSWVYLKNITMPNEASHGNRLGVYKADKSVITGFPVTTSETGLKAEFDTSGNLVKFYCEFTDLAYIRISAWYIGEDSIISVGNPIE